MDSVKTRDAAVIVLAGGRGARLGSGILPPKGLRLLGGVPLARWSLRTLARLPRVGGAVVVIPPEQSEAADAMTRDIAVGVKPIAGGATRRESVSAALEALAVLPPRLVLIHDAARPFVSAALAESLLDALAEADAACPTMPLVDALRAAKGSAVSREGMVAVQTPQAFHFATILAAHRAHRARLEEDPTLAEPEDDLALLAPEARVSQLAGERDNFKITYPQDFADAEARLARLPARIGAGQDTHRFARADEADAQPLTLCGVCLADAPGVIAHSDGDAAYHALTDAIFAAMGEADIGAHFSPQDARWRGAASARFVAEAMARLHAKGGHIENAVITILCERPKLAPHRAAMRANVAAALDIAPSRVAIHAKTGEGMGFIGRAEGFAAQAQILARLP